MEQLSEGQFSVFFHYFTSKECPVCFRSKRPRWCFCRTCYFALTLELRNGLWTPAFDGTTAFVENYQRAKAWLDERGVGNQAWAS
jgi:hypothetical protein